MVADYVSWQKTFRRKQQTYINGLSEQLKSGNLSQPEQVAITEEYETAREDLKQFLEGSFKLEEDNWLPKYTKLQDLVNNEMTCQLIKQLKKRSFATTDAVLGGAMTAASFQEELVSNAMRSPRTCRSIPII